MGNRYVPHPPGHGYHPGKPIIAPVCYGSGQATPGIAASVQDIHEIGRCVSVVIAVPQGSLTAALKLEEVSCLQDELDRAVASHVSTSTGRRIADARRPTDARPPPTPPRSRRPARRSRDGGAGLQVQTGSIAVAMTGTGADRVLQLMLRHADGTGLVVHLSDAGLGRLGDLVAAADGLLAPMGVTLQ